ncbi:MAG TPA: methylated-DNA--[protein]-cysteine S-methyltransferase [Azospirillaceae bacterium]|nr:methylated-DNA--[protein]-cysteine S-methyltransferase [Azospirillaceae bacterium]
MPSLTFDSPLGLLHLAGDGAALTALGWGRAKVEAPDPVLEEAERQLRDWLAHRRQSFDLPLRPAGTAFQLRVWAAMMDIPHGRTATYGDLAQRLLSAPRAVGGACGKNPIPIIIPCHRVVGASGLTGYSGGQGLSTKVWLLQHEEGFTQGALPLAAP